MMRRRLIVIATNIAALRIAVRAQEDAPMAKQLVAMTNRIREAHGLGPVTWNTEKATKVQEYADSCPGSEHSQIGGFENLAPFTPCESEEVCLKDPGASWMWYNDEEEKWDYERASCQGEWTDCGHFSNMMGPNVTSIGCGWSTCASESLVWCHYEGGAETNPAVPLRSMEKEELHRQLESGVVDKSSAPSDATAAAIGEDGPGVVHSILESTQTFADSILNTLKDSKSVALVPTEAQTTLMEVMTTLDKLGAQMNATTSTAAEPESKPPTKATTAPTPSLAFKTEAAPAPSPSPSRKKPASEAGRPPTVTPFGEKPAIAGLTPGPAVKAAT